MPTWSFADRVTGQFSGRGFTGREDHLQLNTPEGHVAVLGEHDPVRFRFDGTQVVPFDDPRGGEQKKARTRASHERALQAVDGLSQRALRELAINPNDQQARQRLVELEARAEQLRTVIRGNNGTT